MKYFEVTIPFLGTNDSECELLEWKVSPGDKIDTDQIAFVVETTKTVMDIPSPTQGHIYPLANANDLLSVGDPVGLIFPRPIKDSKELDKIIREFKASKNPKKSKKKITKKAELLMGKLEVNADDILSSIDGDEIKEKDVRTYVQSRKSQEARRGFGNLQRIGIIGGVAGGGALILVDAIFRSQGQKAEFIFDQDPKYHGKNVLGVPVAGDSKLIEKYFKEDRLDALVVAFNRNLEERQQVFEHFLKKGFPFCNIIDPSVDLRSQVLLGVGNVALGHVYMGACTQIGDNNFISGNVWLEHGNLLGSHCAFGPGVVTSGNVTMGSRIRFGTGIFIEPELSIGDDVVISSGSILRQDIPEKSVVRVELNQEVSDIKQFTNRKNK